MPIIKFKGRKIEVDEDGYLAHSADWSRDLAIMMAEQDGIKLTDSHWEIINLVKEFRQEYGISLRGKILIREIYIKFGEGKGNKDYIDTLFPNNPAKMSNKYAGNPKPLC